MEIECFSDNIRILRTLPMVPAYCTTIVASMQHEMTTDSPV